MKIRTNNLIKQLTLNFNRYSDIFKSSCSLTNSKLNPFQINNIFESFSCLFIYLALIISNYILIQIIKHVCLEYPTQLSR